MNSDGYGASRAPVVALLAATGALLFSIAGVILGLHGLASNYGRADPRVAGRDTQLHHFGIVVATTAAVTLLTSGLMLGRLATPRRVGPACALACVALVVVCAVGTLTAAIRFAGLRS